MATITDGDADKAILRDDSEAAEDPTVLEAASAGPSDVFQNAKALTISVNPARVASGRYDHGRNRDIGEGDIHASYSADRIASGQPVRKPFQHDGALWICTSITGSGLTSSGTTEHEAYRLIVERLFNGMPTTYGAKTGTGEAAEVARNDPSGFYHGVTVKHGHEAFVLCGPPLRFTVDEAADRPGENPNAPDPLQLSLF